MREGARGCARVCEGCGKYREALVEHAQLAIGALLVSGVDEDTAVQDGAVYVAHHGADVARGVLVLLAPVDVVEDRQVPVGRVALIARVDLLATALGELHLRATRADARVRRQARSGRIKVDGVIEGVAEEGGGGGEAEGRARRARWCGCG